MADTTYTVAPPYVLIPPQPEMYGSKPRSSKWPEVRHQHLDKEPVCRGCGTKTNLQVHHEKPYHKYPELELVDSNLITVCAYCHFTICHANNWQFEVDTVVADLLAHRTRVYEAHLLWEKDRGRSERAGQSDPEGTDRQGDEPPQSGEVGQHGPELPDRPE